MAIILLADDDAATLDMLARALTADGHRVITAHDGQEALELGSAAQPAFEVLITDVQMPIIDGISLAEQMLAAFPELKVILMSGLQSEMARAGRLSIKPVQFLLKPIKLDGMKAAVRLAIGC